MAQKKDSRRSKPFDYDVCLSFAGENRSFVRRVAASLKEHGIRVFFDEYEEAALWGRDLYSHLSDVYERSARFCVLFASRQYARKVWTNHERQSAQARAIREHAEYILPARFDKTAIPGLRGTVHYIDLRRTSATKLADLIRAKIGNRPVENYFPPVPDRLFSRLGVTASAERDDAAASAHSFFTALRRMTTEERHVLTSVFRYCCPTELPDNVHINIDYLRRVTGVSSARAVRLLGGVRSLGVESSVRKARRNDDEGDVMVVQWHDHRISNENPDTNATGIAAAVIDGALEDYCDECGNEHLARMDFSQLATVTAGTERHTSRKRRSRLTRHAADGAAAVHTRRG
jgi:hypothetical protein